MMTVLHPLGFDVEDVRERACGGGRQVRGLIDPGVPVPAAAVPLDDPLHLRGGNVPRAFEVHVFDPVRCTGQTRRLVPRTDAIPAPRGDQRHGVYFLNEEGESVRKYGALNGGAQGGHVHRTHVSII
jgi:hypothetical protein